MRRSLRPEQMDDPNLTPAEHRRALRGLTRLNRISGVADAMYRYLYQYAISDRSRSLNVLDVASGAGDVPINWAKRAKRDGLALDITTLDISPTAIAEQQRRATAANVELESIQCDCLHSDLPTGYDVVTSSLFMHHLDDDQVIHVLRSMRKATNDKILICDLERSRFNLAIVTIGSHLVTRSKVVHFDGPQSVRAAYTKSEFASLAQHALGSPMKLQSAFPCRFIAMNNQ
ncbi:hypothetical protein Q31b_15390 [Novipirellula aureliae]|uniref:Methyltransferase domain-containing protein n=1 Tax=Novipirellula aureliae TaxID=2527966 RepID=A0A5C6E610_9BACT|nr:methyltransferase domain-containing protein [Novipirellula aureliae]TWU44004.1 hypothetical protein Q31b_15390 [Novipirellula aureliae]